jgi:hypothetical protein
MVLICSSLVATWQCRLNTLREGIISDLEISVLRIDHKGHLAIKDETKILYRAVLLSLVIQPKS